MNPRVVIVGAGVVGAALAQRLARLGWPTTLIDQYPPGDLRAASSGSERFLRTAHGGDEQDTESAVRARGLWRELDLATAGGFLTETGLAFFVQQDDPWLEGSCRLLRALRIPHNVVDRAAAGSLFPTLRLADGEVLLVEEEAGVLSARQAVQCLVDDAVTSGATFISARATPAGGAAAVAGQRLAADRTVWACGAWNAALFGEFIDTEVIEQDNFFFGGPGTWEAAPLPAWSDLVRKFSGTCDVDGRGAKVASDCRGPRLDLDGPRESHDPAQEAAARDYLTRRFPALARAPLTGVEPCHSAVVRRNDLPAVATPGEFRIARHPEFEDAWILGDGAGHAFKHAPAIASLMEGLLA